MDQTEYHSKQTLTQLINIQFLKKITQLLVSVSVFSFFFSYPSLLSFLQSFNLSLSTFPLHLFSHTLDKNCIFLLCNGLLVFLAKYSGLIRSLSGSNHNEESFKSIGDGLQPESLILETKQAMLDKEALVLESTASAENVVVEHGREMDHFIKEVEKETDKSVVEEGESRLSIPESEEEEEEEEEGNGMLSTEELNKKFDDFIRRVKEEIRIEAQQQLVMV